MISHNSELTIDDEFIDQYGHVNYKRVPDVLESAQDALLADRNVTFESLDEDFGLRSFVKKITITWNGEMKKGDVCYVVTTLTLGRTSMTFKQVLALGGVSVVELEMVVVLVNVDGRPTQIPAEIRTVLEN